ncbi:hypothetical protein D3C81_1297050 [compost metagenome]
MDHALSRRNGSGWQYECDGFVGLDAPRSLLNRLVGLDLHILPAKALPARRRLCAILAAAQGDAWHIRLLRAFCLMGGAALLCVMLSLCRTFGGIAICPCAVEGSLRRRCFGAALSLIERVVTAVTAHPARRQFYDAVHQVQ